jgi:hypothetical protein
VLTGKKLTYAVTPKGEKQEEVTRIGLFYPHLILGTITLFCLEAGLFAGRLAPLLVFWAAMNTVILYGLFLSALWKNITAEIARVHWPKVQLPLLRM